MTGSTAVGRVETETARRLRNAALLGVFNGGLPHTRMRLVRMTMPSQSVLHAMLSHPRSLGAMDRGESAWWLESIGEVQNNLARVEEPYYRLAWIADRIGVALFWLVVCTLVVSFGSSLTGPDEVRGAIEALCCGFALVALLAAGLFAEGLVSRAVRQAGEGLGAIAASLPGEMWAEHDAGVSSLKPLEQAAAALVQRR